MKQQARTCLVCDCERTMPLDPEKLGKALGRKIGPMNTQLCRSQLGNFENALAGDQDILVACTQEAPLFQEVADEQGRGDRVSFVNIRENAGWSADAARASPKIAALLAAADHMSRPAQLKAIESDGLCLVYGSGQSALEAAQLLSKTLSVTLIVPDDADLVPPLSADIAIYRGQIKQLSGSFGAFSLTVDNYAPLMPSSRDGLNFVMPRDGARSTCSLVLDLSGRLPLVTGHTHRDGYKRVDPGDPAAVLRAVIALSDMSGSFEKPIYVDYNRETCAHARSQKVGCSKCLDICPAGAIAEEGDFVNIDSGICGGCGSCHAVCPTGSISYRYPPREDFIDRAQLMVETYAAAGGGNPALLLHDETFGAELIAAMARFGRGLPANVLPVPMHMVTSVGHVEMAALFAGGLSQIFILANPQQADEVAGLECEAQLCNTILNAFGFGDDIRIRIMSEADPDPVEEALWSPTQHPAIPGSTFTAVGSKRDIARLAFARLHEAASTKPDLITLDDGAPYGRVLIDQAACTLCMACTSACPTGAIIDTPGEPKLRFTESACVQCGLCVKTCPESALRLEARLNLMPSAMQPVTLYEEAPFECVSCGKPFATKSTIGRIKSKLAGKHYMFADETSSRMIEMCEDCRLEAMANSQHDPFTAGLRPKVRTTEDYLEARKTGRTADDFLMDD